MAKRKIQKLNSRKMVSYGMFAVAIIAPLSNFPQIYKLFSLKVTTGLSIETWIMYVVFALIQLIYAISNNIKPLILSNVLWIVVELIMIYGIISLNVAQEPPTYSSLLLINNVGKAIMGLGIMCFSSAAALYAYDLYNYEKGKLT